MLTFKPTCPLIDLDEARKHLRVKGTSALVEVSGHYYFCVGMAFMAYMKGRLQGAENDRLQEELVKSEENCQTIDKAPNARPIGWDKDIFAIFPDGSAYISIQAMQEKYQYLLKVLRRLGEAEMRRQFPGGVEYLTQLAQKFGYRVGVEVH